ncbi:MAG: DNA-3-methyladenine glycosylase I [Bdellovibrionia bacterium]
MKKTRCTWPGSDPLMVEYHDREWGVPNHNDKIHFEFLLLEAAQAGLSWSTVLKRREGYRKAFAGFDPKKVVKFNKAKAKVLLKDSGIIRNRLKVDAAITNAKLFLEVQKEFGSFDKYCWSFVGNKPIVNQIKSLGEIVATTPESDAFSKDLKKRGFGFVGSTIIYAYMQAMGMVNDHMTTCFRYREVKKR